MCLVELAISVEEDCGDAGDAMLRCNRLDISEIAVEFNNIPSVALGNDLLKDLAQLDAGRAPVGVEIDDDRHLRLQDILLPVLLRLHVNNRHFLFLFSPANSLLL